MQTFPRLHVHVLVPLKLVKHSFDQVRLFRLGDTTNVTFQLLIRLFWFQTDAGMHTWLPR